MAFEEPEWWEVLVPERGLFHSLTLNWKKRETIKYHHRKTGPQPECFVRKKNGEVKSINSDRSPLKRSLWSDRLLTRTVQASAVLWEAA